MSVEYAQDGPEAQRIASVIPYYPFHGVPRFYDISGMTHDPEAFQLCIDVFTRRYADLEIDCIAGLDARGFVLGPPIALALKKPFVMVRKAGKLPNSVSGGDYFKEYQGANAAGGDSLCLSRTAIKPGSRVLVIDDLVATGGTLIAACDLLAATGAVIVECACMVELKMLGGYAKLQEKHPGVKVYGLISEDILQLKGDLPEGDAAEEKK
jgi:adenine phosphoribosyltransferase